MSTTLSPLQCPNPACLPGTLASRAYPVLVGHGERGLKALLYSPWAWLGVWLLYCLLAIAAAAFVIGAILRDPAGLVPWLVFSLLLFALGQGLIRLRGSLDQFEMQQQRCRRCKYRWINVPTHQATMAVQIRWLQHELDRARARDERAKIGMFAGSLGGLTIMHQGDCARAIELCREALAFQRQGGERVHLAYALNNLGVSGLYCDQSIDPIPLREESVAIFRELREWNGLAHARNSLGDALLHAGEGERATPLLAEALPLALKRGKAEGAE